MKTEEFNTPCLYAITISSGIAVLLLASLEQCHDTG